jgi:hypothetical protein
VADPACCPLAALLDEATDRLGRWLLAWLAETLGQDSDVRKLGVQGLCFSVTGGGTVGMELFGEQQLEVLVDVRTGAFVVPAGR